MKTNLNPQAGWPFPTQSKPAAMTAVFPEYTLLDKAKALGIGLVHIKNDCNPKGGLTVAFSKSSPYKSGRMVEVAVATCSIEDTFSRKMGTNNALQKFFDGETIQLPLLNSCYDEDLNWTIKQAFTALYNYMEVPR